MTYITPIFDRTLADVSYARENQDEVSKGAYNYVDLNRIENNTRCAADEMYRKKVVDQPIQLNSKYDWNENDVPTKEDLNRIVNNILLLKELSVEGLEWTNFAIGGQINYIIANAIEKNIDAMYKQEPPPPEKFYLKVENGTGTGYYLDKEVVQINANFPPSNMMFEKWSGSPEALARIGNIYASATTFTVDMSYGESMTITANYIGTVPHRLIVNDGIVSGDYTYGEIVTLQANKAPNGKVFYRWDGEFAKDNCVNYKASTTSFTMPNQATSLSAFYISPNKHQLTVYGGSGSGWYEFEDQVYISGNSPGKKYVFSHWSGPGASRLTDASSESTSFLMGDFNTSITANYRYVPDGPWKLEVRNGTGSGEYMENSSHSISAVAPSGDVGFVKWTKISGPGLFGNVDSASTTFYMGSGHTVIEAQFAKKRHVTVNNGSGSGDYPIGRRVYISANSPASNQVFDKWSGDSTSTSSSFSFIIQDKDYEFTANYRDKNTYNVTVNNGTGSGSYPEKANVNVRANDPASGYAFSGWSKSGGGSLYNSSAQSTTLTVGTSDTVLTPNYKALHHLIVNSGSGSGTYMEGTSVRIVANSAPAGYRFKSWEGDTSRVSNPASTSTYYNMGTSDGTVTATYEPLPDWNLTVNKGTGDGTYKNGTSVQIIADPAPDGYVFLTWIGDVDNVANVFASTTTITMSKDCTITATYYIPDAPEYFNLVVNQGYGTGSHAAGSEVNIQANAPLEGYEFWKWIGDVATVRDVRASETTMVMPMYATTITATYKPIGSEDLYTLTVNFGEGSGDYEQYEEVPIKANPPSNGFRFDKWMGDVENVKELYKSETIFTVGITDATITATYIELPKYALKVNDGLGTGSYYEKQRVNIIANLVDNDDVHYEFQQWSNNPNIENRALKDTYFTMPAEEQEITAEYIRRYHLNAIFANGSGYFQEGEKVQIEAHTIEENMKFVEWVGDISVLSNPYNPKPIVTMPNTPVMITAKFEKDEGENSVGYYDKELTENENVLTSDTIEMISGTLDIGTIITDTIGNIAVCYDITDENYHFQRIFYIDHLR